MTMVTLLFVGAALLGGSAWARRSHPRPTGPLPGRTAAEVLDARFARGELDEREYLRCRAFVTRRPVPYLTMVKRGAQAGTGEPYAASVTTTGTGTVPAGTSATPAMT